jgi:hypothetical protein
MVMAASQGMWFNDVKLAIFRLFSKDGSIVSSSKNAFFEDETFKMCLSSSKEGFIEDESRQKTKTAAQKAAESFV